MYKPKEQACLEKLKSQLNLLNQSAPGPKKNLRSSALGIDPFQGGCIIECVGFEKTEFILKLLQDNPNADVIWMESDFNIYPPAMAARGVDLSRIFFLETNSSSNLKWIVWDLLKEGLVDLLVLGSWRERWSTIEWRRFQVLAKYSGALVCLLSDQLTSSWCISLQVRAQGGQLNILKDKRNLQ